MAKRQINVRRYVTYKDADVELNIYIYVTPKAGNVGSVEANHCGDALADKAMVALTEAPIFRPNLSRIKVSR